MSHLSAAFAPFLSWPAPDVDIPPLLVQLPIIRCLFQGRTSVAVFAIMTGYVNSLKPIKQMRAGQAEASLLSIAKSAFRRTGRFIIPVAVATFFSWLMCQFGAYNLARVVDADWIRNTSPPPSASFAGAFWDLFRNLISVWTDGGNIYDPILWTMTYLLRGSVLIYFTLVAVVFVQPRYRILVYTVMELYYWWIGDAVIGINIFAGMTLAELTCSPEFNDYADSRPITTEVLSACALVLGIIGCSFPEDHAEWAGWSQSMLDFGYYLFPGGAEQSRFWPALGSQLLCLGIMYNKTAKALFSSSFPCFLGKYGYAIYLTHAPFMRTTLTWMLYGLSVRPPSPGEDEEGNPIGQPWIPQTSPWITIIALPSWFFLLYRMAHLWVGYVEPFAARVTDWCEETMWRDDGRTEKLQA